MTRFFMGIAAFSLVLVFAGANPAVAAVVYFEDFELGLPPGWSVVDNLANGTGWVDDNPCARDGFGGEPWVYLSGGILIADSDCQYTNPSYYPLDTDLISNVIDLTGITNVELSFAQDFQSYLDEDDAYFSIDDGTGDVLWLHLDGIDASDQRRLWDFGGAYDGDTVTLKWRYVAPGGFQWFWAVDDLLIEGDCTIDGGALAVDTGTNGATFAGADGEILALCLTPDGSPSWLTEISAYFDAGSAETGEVRFVVYRDREDAGPPEREVFVSGAFTPAADTWNALDVSGESEFAVPINGGSWCVGVQWTAGGAGKLLALDDASASLDRAYTSDTPGVWEAYSGASPRTPMIRATHDFCVRPATTTTIPSTTTTTGQTTTSTAGTTTTGASTSTTAGTTTTVPDDDDDDAADDDDEQDDDTAADTDDDADDDGADDDLDAGDDDDDGGCCGC
ncbi:hypothetical protein K8I61_08900 [bacterium]|nr:hypothetical protein [bacterium]